VSDVAYSPSPPVLCARCGHDRQDHERTHHDHGTVCWAAPAEGAESCSCDGCSDDPEARRCPCRSFRAAKPKAVDAAARESRGAL
jgi:hypothetical protein